MIPHNWVAQNLGIVFPPQWDVFLDQPVGEPTEIEYLDVITPSGYCYRYNPVTQQWINETGVVVTWSVTNKVFTDGVS